MKTLTPITAWALCALLLACSEAPTPKLEIPAPIVQGNEVRFTKDHPQLGLLTLGTAVPAQSMLVDLPAKLVWNEERTQRIYPAFAGRVTAIRADVGDRVTAGSALATLASPEFGQAQGDTARAQAYAQLARKALQRQTELFEAGVVARKDLEQAQAEDASAQAELERAQSRTRLYGSAQGVNQQLALSASINGVVVERNLNPGQEVRPELSGPGVPALFVVSDPSSLWVQVDARESDLAMVRPGTRFELVVPALAGQRFEGRVIAASDFIDPVSRTVKVRGIVANPERRLKADMLASARMERRFAGGVVIPATAVQLRGSVVSAFVQTQPGVFERREVSLEYEGPKELVVSQGIRPGEEVVIENGLLLARLLRMAREDAKAPEKPGDSAINSGASQKPGGAGAYGR